MRRARRWWWTQEKKEGVEGEKVVKTMSKAASTKARRKARMRRWEEMERLEEEFLKGAQAIPGASEATAN